MRVGTILRILTASITLSIAAVEVQAATSLTESVWYILGSENSGGASFNLSVNTNHNGYQGTTGANGPVHEGFGATIIDYRFFQQDGGEPGLIGSYADGGGGRFALPSAPATGGNNNSARIWTTNDPGPDYSTAADYSSATMVQMYTCTGTIDISGLTNGTVYFFYGAYRNTPKFDLTMTGPGQPDVQLLGAGDTDYANNNEMYVVGIDFTEAWAYDTITYVFSIPEINAGRGRYAGSVLVTALTDTNAPTPSPMTWESVPTAVSETVVIMTATNATDAEGAPVWYLFKNLTLVSESGWQASRTWTNTGLSAGTTYDYTVEARDQTRNRNATLPSTPAASVTTLSPDTNAPPTPSFTSPPAPYYPYEPYQVTMTASVVTDPETNGVEYYFTCTAGGGNDSGWQDSTNYTDTGLTPETLYEYTVKARDKSLAQNESAPSAATNATTLKAASATLTDPGASSHFIFGPQAFDVSVWPGDRGFRCLTNSISEVFNGGIKDYAFINESATANVIRVYADSGSGRISYTSYEGRAGGDIGSGNNMDNLWTTNYPGTPDWTNAANHSSALDVGPFNFMEGTIDVSAIEAGSLYFFYGGYRSTPYFDVVIKDTDGPETALPLTGFGDEDYANGAEWYCKRIDFINPTEYDTIDWYLSSSLYGGYPHCSLAGIILVRELPPGSIMAVY